MDGGICVDASLTESYCLKFETSKSVSESQRPTVLLVHNAFSRFVQIDCELLAKHYRVTVQHEVSARHINVLQLWSQVRRHDFVFCWFASWHSFLPVLIARLLGKPAVVVIGGYDVASLPQVGYGSQRRGLKKYLARAVMQLATHLLPFSKSAYLEARTNARISPGKLSVAYLAVAKHTSAPQPQRERMVLTVGIVCKENLLRKGLLPFVQASHLLPDVRFVHAGPSLDDSMTDLRAAAGSNIEFLGKVTDEELARLYRRASVYVQASLHEGFGMSVAEAMASGCIPVTTRAGSLPELVGDCGIFLPDPTPQAIAAGIRLALSEDYQLRLRAQHRIQQLFSLEERERRLTTILDKLLSRQPITQTESQLTIPAIE